MAAEANNSPNTAPPRSRGRAETAKRTLHLIQSALIFLVLCGIAYYVAETERARLEQGLRNNVSQKALEIAARLQYELNANVLLATGMIPLVNAVPDAKAADFEAALRAMYRQGRHIRNIGVAPDNRILRVYPLQGNEDAIGLFYPDNPKQWPSVKRAIVARKTVLGGPVELVQGGSGLISRTPVFLDSGKYWGILSLVMDTAAVFKAAGLAEVVDDTYFAVRGKDGLGAKGAMILGDEKIFTTDVVTERIDVPGGHWVLAARPIGGWTKGQGYILVLQINAMIAAFLFTAVFYGYQRSRLRLESSERRQRAYLDTARDAVVVVDRQGVILEFNRAAETHLGCTAEEALGHNVSEFLPEIESGDIDLHLGGAAGPSAELASGEQQVSVRRKDGTTYPAEVSVGNTEIGGQRVHVCVVRNITGRKRFEQQLLDLANTDPLTGALNRRAFMEAAEDLFGLARRHNRPLSFMMIDADHFKKVNDTHGHQAGDVVLKWITNTIGKDLRTTDKLGRIGGEEFALILPETDAERAVDVAERLLNDFRGAEIEIGDGKAVSITVSIGISTLTEKTEYLDGLMQEADEALYKAKSTGRDRWRMAGDAPQEVEQARG
jgi:diguanylate cyclase (GGDEF)-like protein/PAS domain S-box-containing protein